VREIMNAVCGGSKLSAAPHTGAVIGIATVLADRQRLTEAQGLLLRAERAAKEANDRFLLRLEQLKLVARDLAWQPQRDTARIAALARLDATDEDALQSWLGFLKLESQGARAKGWAGTLAALPTSPLATLGLCAFAPQLEEKQAALLPSAWLKAEGHGTTVQRMAVEELLRHDKAAWAHAIAISGRGAALRESPVMVRVFHALGNKHALDELYADLVRQRFPGGGDVVGFCNALADTGHGDLAASLCDLALQQQRAIGISHTPLVHRYARLLIQQRRFEEAETLMMREDDALTVDTADILVLLYREWNKLDRLPQELAKFHLPDGMLSEAKFRAKAAK
jgi:hypothetical protein